ncbi:MAG: DUF1326 domain-containing protein [Spirochaetia bacterium]|jgi:hypothetical protein
MVDWEIEGRQIGICSCAWGCPCQFNAPPTMGYCHASGAIHIDRGHFGAVSLDGLSYVTLYRWPGAIHEGNGEAQYFIDGHGTPEQQRALVTVLSGEESVPGATLFSVFASTLTRVHEPIFLPIEFTLDMEKREAHFAVNGIVDGRSEPIRNPVTGEVHRVGISLPNGFEFTSAEFASGTLRSNGTTINLDLVARHSHFSRLHWTGRGIVRG